MSCQTPLPRSKHRTLAGEQRNHMNHYLVIQMFPSTSDSFNASEGWIYCHSYLPFAQTPAILMVAPKSTAREEKSDAERKHDCWTGSSLVKDPNPLAQKSNDAGHLSCCCCCDHVVWMLMRSFTGLDKHCASDKHFNKHCQRHNGPEG